MNDVDGRDKPGHDEERVDPLARIRTFLQKFPGRCAEAVQIPDRLGHGCCLADTPGKSHLS